MGAQNTEAAKIPDGKKEDPATRKKVDQALVERTQRGERGAFDVLVLKYQGRVLNIVGRFVRDRSEAQDVTQEAFIKAYRAIGSFRGDSQFYTWLYRIAVNTAKNYLASQSRRPTDQMNSADIDDPESYSTPDILRNMDSPEALTLTEEMQHTIARAIKELPDDLREAISLRELEGLSYDEIAQAMSCPIGTVRSRIFRAREAISRELNDLDGTPVAI